MAKRRMITLDIYDTDAFIEMPHSTQCLYTHLLVRADDEGFIGNPRVIMKMLGSAEDDMKILVAKKFVIPFESGVCVIKHWKMHNYIPKDRFATTRYTKEKALIREKSNNVYKLYTDCIRDVYTGKDRIGKVSIDKDNNNVSTDVATTQKSSDFDFSMVDMLVGYIEGNNPRYSDGDTHLKYNRDKWANVFRLMREADKFSEEQIAFLVKFSQEHDFWKNNILSPDKLRKQVDKLILEAKRKKVSGNVVSV